MTVRRPTRGPQFQNALPDLSSTQTRMDADGMVKFSGNARVKEVDLLSRDTL